MKLSQLSDAEVYIGMPVYSAIGTWGVISKKDTRRGDTWITIDWSNHNDSIMRLNEAEFITCLKS